MKAHRRNHKRAAAGCAALACILAGAQSASAAIGPEGIRAGKNITVFSNLDFVASFGNAEGEMVQVDVIREGHRIATARGPAAVGGPDPGALEVNHGPEGAAAPGDCWEGATPDVRSGDLIRVTSGGGVDEVIVDDVSLDSVTRQPGANGLPGDDDDEIWVEGVARSGLDGSPIDVGILDSSEFRDPLNNQLRLEANEVVAGATEGTYVAKYRAPFVFVKGAVGTQTALQALLRDGHAVGYGHVPLADGSLRPDAMLIDGMDTAGGPALGCESAPKEASSAGTVSTDVINAATMDALADSDTALGVGGWADALVTDADVELRDAAGATVTVAAKGLKSGATAQQGWTAEFRKDEVSSLQQGELTARLIVGGTPVGAVKTVLYDTVAPSFSVSPGAGSYVGTQHVAVTGLDAGDTLSYELDGGAAQDYAGAIRLLPGDHALVVRATDPAGNLTVKELAYAIEAPPAPKPEPEPIVTDPAPPVVVATPVAPRPANPVVVVPRTSIAKVTAPRKVSLTRARRGVRVLVTTTAASITAKANKGAKVTTSRRRGGYTVVFTARRKGTYRITVTPANGASRIVSLKVA